MAREESTSQPVVEGFSEYELRIDFELGTDEPARVFDSMAALIKTFELFDEHLASSIAASIRPGVYLQGIDAGSLTTKLRVLLESIDDSALEELDWKQIVGSYLVRAKKHAIRWLRDRETVKERKDIEQLRDQLQRLAEDTGVRRIALYQKIPIRVLMVDLVNLSKAVDPLIATDTVKFIAEGEVLELNTSFGIAEDSLQEILVERTIEDRQERVLQVKKPDYLGQSMWDMRDEGHTVHVKILDEKWLRRFQEREETVRPGDALRADVERKLGLDDEGNLVFSRYSIHKVHKVLPRPRWRQELLFPDRRVDESDG